MKLDESQTAKVREWIASGLQPADLQKRIGEEFGASLTYMEVRFLLADLDLKPQDKDIPADPAVGLAAKGGPPTPGAGGASPAGSAPGSAHGGGVAVTVDQVTRAGSMVSGQVTFSDGQRAEWYLDQMGRLGLSPQQKGYKPSQTDVMDFQTALQNEMAKLGF